MTTPEQPDPLQPVLRDVEQELSRRLHEACEVEARGLSTESTDEVRRLEDALLAAAVAAEQSIALRRHMRQRDDAERTGRGAGPGGDEEIAAHEAQPADTEEIPGRPGSEPVSAVREFTDSSGRAWRAWPVTPDPARAGRGADRFLGEFQQGWICFEALDSSARRRLPCTRSRWVGVRDEELEQLLEQAITAPDRKGGQR